MSIQTIEADIKARVESARSHLETFVNEHMAGIHQTLADLSTEVEAVAASPVVAEVEALLPANIVEALKLVEGFMAEAAKATQGDFALVPPAPAAEVPSGPVGAPAVELPTATA